MKTHANLLIVALAMIATFFIVVDVVTSGPKVAFIRLGAGFLVGILFASLYRAYLRHRFNKTLAGLRSHFNEGELRVDGKVIPFLYQTSNEGGHQSYYWPHATNSNPVLLALSNDPEFEATVEQVKEDQARPTLDATLILEEMQIALRMSKRQDRCPCDRTPPCFTLAQYEATILQEPEEGTLNGVVVAFWLTIPPDDRGRRRRHKVQQKIWSKIPPVFQPTPA